VTAAPDRINWVGTIPVWIVHLVPLLAIFTGVPWQSWVLLAVTYTTRMFFITGGYHRYFAHRGFRCNRVVRFVLAFGGATAAQKGPLWWAANHRHHHRTSDTPADPHSPIHGFWWSHLGWILSSQHDATRSELIRDLTASPELRWLDRHNWVPPWALAISCLLIGGWPGLLIGFFLSTVLVWHATFMVNSVVHRFGTRRYDTGDDSRNHLGVALLTLGEGWHNNHHHHPTCARQGFRWWEIDVTWQILRVLAALRLVSDLKTPSAAARRRNLLPAGRA
jgi:stearoyl-CoA desaturase (delta-9 desaturase)